MDREEWLNQFCDELLKLRGHLSEKFARTVALSQYAAAEHPRVAARDYHKQRSAEVAPAPTATARKRAKG